MKEYTHEQVMEWVNLYGTLEKQYGFLKAQFGMDPAHIDVRMTKEYSRAARGNLRLLNERVPVGVRNGLHLDTRDLEAICDKADLL